MFGYVDLDVKVTRHTTWNSFASTRHTNHFSVLDTGGNSDFDLFFAAANSGAGTMATLFFWYFSGAMADTTLSDGLETTHNTLAGLTDAAVAITGLTGGHLSA